MFIVATAISPTNKSLEIHSLVSPRTEELEDYTLMWHNVKLVFPSYKMKIVSPKPSVPMLLLYHTQVEPSTISLPWTGSYRGLA
jgi:hypothetical protein